jgi:1-acyl-sn-glycerol-3-phosphate acyltransferase
MPIYFPNDSYHTPENTPRAWLDRLAMGSRVYFFAGFLGRVWRSWRLVQHGRYDRATWAATSYDVLRFVERCGGRFHITGLACLRQQPGPFVFISNHMSSLETAVMPAIIAPLMPITFVAKSSLLKYPFFGKVISATHPIFVDRTNPRHDFEAVIKQGLAALAKGTSVGIYPQSTRTAVFDPQAFNSMGVKLAKKGNVPIIPVAVKTDFWANGKYLKDFGPIHRDRPIHLAFGAPFPIGTDSKLAHQQVIEFIQSHLQRWQESI